MIAAVRTIAALVALAPVAPIPSLGLGAGSGAPGSLFAPTAFSQTIRVPPSGTALYVITSWYTDAMTVVLVGPGGARRRLVAADDLPGRTLGVRLPDDAWRADRVEIDGTAVSAAASASLVPAEAFGIIAWHDWWRIAAFGALGTLALGIGAFAMRRRSAMMAAPAAFAAANAALLVPWLGFVRFAPAVSQPLHALEAIAALAAAYAVVVVTARSVLAAWMRRALAALVALQAAVLLGADVFQDLWPMNGVEATLLEVLVALAFAVATARAARARVPGAGYAFAATAIAAAAVVAAAVAPEGASLAATAPVLAALVASALFATAVDRATHRPSGARPAFGDPAFDTLTQIPNGRALDDALARACDDALRRGAPVGALAVGLDRFSRFNATRGHRAGDDALRAAAAELARVADGAGGFVARDGGDVFVVLVPSAGPEASHLAGEAARAAIAGLAIEHAGVPARVLTASVGAASMEPGAGEPSALLVRAATALALAKALGRNRVVTDEHDAGRAAPRLAAP